MLTNESCANCDTFQDGKFSRWRLNVVLKISQLCALSNWFKLRNRKMRRTFRPLWSAIIFLFIYFSSHEIKDIFFSRLLLNRKANLNQFEHQFLLDRNRMKRKTSNSFSFIVKVNRALLMKHFLAVKSLKISISSCSCQAENCGDGDRNRTN